MMHKRFAVALLFLLALVVPAAHAQVRAWLDRDRIEAGETTTLNIAAESLDSAPDYAPLLRDFELSGHSSQRSASAVNGRVTMHTQYSVVLQPRREGVFTIPALQVGNRTTPPITLTVLPASRVPARAGDVAFIETEIDHADPYVQQAVGLKVRLYYAVPLVSGDLDQPAPKGATLRKVGQDLQYSQEMSGRRYNVVERRFLLVPERSGRVVLEGARFRGQGVGGFFDDLFGDGRTPLAANAPDRVVRVRPIPANAPQPWLPLEDLRLRYVALPRNARAGESATVQVEAVADGAVAAQVPEMRLTTAGAAQVFPASTQADESFAEGRPRTTVSRTFSIVPTRAGALRIDAPRIEWWDVRAGVVRTATLPPIDLQVAPGVAGNVAAAPDASGPDAKAATSTDDGRIAIPGIQGRVLPWAAAAAAFALLWLLTFLWALGRKPHAPNEDDDAEPAPPPRPDLKRALADGDLGDIADALCASVTPPAADIDALLARIDDDAQRDALELLQRARWAGADPRIAREALRRVFAKGVRVAAPARGPRVPDPLPPLYPPA
ncbi:BatD family protein [Lysobacter sp. A6]|uniref:BatD family protein n=1 Tax=Noviluteimonas lactosilytica TaxID=2888523 RepID=A0ABS8JKR9_9GAMM|nr:BatD family protein [Lysobacter lactosilyticus]MCC8364147.1 BatD family protein [Lysobacter lactosilyticus]